MNLLLDKRTYYIYTFFKVTVVIAQISFRFVGLGMGLAATNKSFGLVM